MGFQHDIDRVIEPLQQARDEEDENRRAELLDEASRSSSRSWVSAGGS
jgi:hypothetical protein